MSVSRVVGLIVVSAWLATACSGSKRIDVGGTCILNSDCNQGLVCTWGKCHAACHTSADCPAGESCITSSDQSMVCQLPGETYCIYNHDCPAALICGVDQKCRKQCQIDVDCPYGQLCTSAQTCVKPNQMDANTVPDGGVSTTGSSPGAGGTGGSPDAFPYLPADVPASAGGAGAVDGGGGAGGANQCDDAGVCTLCSPVRILSLGRPYGAISGSTDNSDAFQAFMNSNTKGTATMQMLPTFTHITGLALSNYDVIILQALEDNENVPPWVYGTDDAAALQDWVTNKGGAIIAMSGYGSNLSEVQPVNTLLTPFGITYDADSTYTSNDCPSTSTWGPLCYCAQGSIAFDNWNSLVPDITRHLGKVGVSMGRSITCPGSDCQVVGTNSVDTAAQSNIAGVAKVVGKGRVFAWGDEWVTHTSQWGLTPDPQYDDAVKYAQCVGYTPMTSYTVPQFWYNVFRWVAQTTCLTIVVPPSAGPVPQIVFD